MSYFEGYVQGLVNINQNVEFKLTNRGQEILDNHNTKVRQSSRFLSEYSASKINSDGLHVMQLYEVMRVFGASINLGHEAPFENCNITITR